MTSTSTITESDYDYMYCGKTTWYRKVLPVWKQRRRGKILKTHKVIGLTLLRRSKYNAWDIVSVIAVKPCALPYIDALLPKDQDLDFQDQEMHHTAAASAPLPPAAMETTAAAGLDESGDSLGGGTSIGDASRYLMPQDSMDTDAIDNPYLRGVRLPKKKR